MILNRILSIEEFTKKQSEENRNISIVSSSNKAKEIVEDTSAPVITKQCKLKPGDFVEDRYGNNYEVVNTTNDWRKADEFDDWDQVSKYKDRDDVEFVIVWAKEQKEKKLVFVFGIEDPHAVRKIDITELNGIDRMTKIFNAVCDNIDNESERSKFKDKWRRFMDMIRAGKIANEKYVMMEILDDFKQTKVLKTIDTPPAKKEINEAAKPELCDSLPNGIYDVLYKNKVYYVKPKPGDTKLFAYIDSNLTNTVKKDGKTLMFTVKDLFGVEKWQKEWIASGGSGSN